MAWWQPEQQGGKQEEEEVTSMCATVDERTLASHEPDPVCLESQRLRDKQQQQQQQQQQQHPVLGFSFMSIPIAA